MNCRQAQHHLFANCDDTLDQQQRAALSAHVGECAACRRIRDELAGSLEAWRADTRAMRVPDADIEWQKLRREIRSTDRTTARRLTGAWLAVPLAAAAAVAIGVFVVTDTPMRPEEGGTQGPGKGGRSVPVTAIASASTVVYVDGQSGWTFVWTPENGSTEQHAAADQHI